MEGELIEGGNPTGNGAFPALDRASPAFDSCEATMSETSPCPYGYPNPHRFRYFIASRCPSAAYEESLATGWRRSGKLFYRNACALCDACVPIRVDSLAVSPRKSQRRAIRANADLSVDAGAMEFREEDYALFRRYLAARHPDDSGRFDEGAYVAAYVESPVDSAIIRYRLPDGSLAALSFVDALPDGLSSVYFAFDPSLARRSLGSYSVFAEVAIARELGKRWYYLGFWVKGCDKMSYKTDFRPFELARDGVWQTPEMGDTTKVSLDARV